MNEAPLEQIACALAELLEEIGARVPVGPDRDRLVELARRATEECDEEQLAA